METQYEKLQILKSRIYEVPGHLADNMYREAYAGFVQGNKPDFNSEDNQNLVDAAKRLISLLPDLVFEDVIEEIDFNLANIPSNEAAVRYLKYISAQAVHFLEMLEDYLNFESYRHAEDMIWEGMADGRWTVSGERAFRDFLEQLGRKALDHSETYKMTDQELEQQRVLYQNRHTITTNAMGYLLQTYVYAIRRCRELVDDISERLHSLLNPQRAEDYKNDLTANSHRLLLFQKMGLFEPLLKAHFNTLGAVRFSRLIATILGIPSESHEGFRPSVNDLIKDLGHSDRKKIQTGPAENKVNAFLAEIGIINQA